MDKVKQMGVWELGRVVRSHWIWFLVPLIGVMAVTAIVGLNKPKEFRIEARVAPIYNPVELEQLDLARRFSSSYLVKSFVDTVNLGEFRRQFFDETVLPALQAKGIQTDAKALFDRFNATLMCKQMDSYAMLYLFSAYPDAATGWMNQLISSASQRAVTNLQEVHTKAIEAVRERIKFREDFFSKKREENLRKLTEEAKQISKDLGIPVNAGVFKSIPPFDSDQETMFEHEALLSLLPEKLAITETVKLHTAPHVSNDIVGFKPVIVLFYGLLMGIIFGTLGAVLRELVGGVMLKSRMKPLQSPA